MSVLWLTETDVAALLSLAEAVDALGAMLPGLHDGSATNIPKALFGWPGGSLHSLGAAAPALGLGGYKNWVNTPRGATAIYNLFDLDSGELRAVIEAGTLGKLRTAAATTLATRALAPATDGAGLTVAIAGSGRQALLQLAAVSLAAPIRVAHVWSPTATHRERFAAEAQAGLGVECRALPTVREAVAGAAVVVTVTRAREPFLALADLTADVHVNAVGSLLPGHRELADDVLDAAGLVVADDPQSAAGQSAEVRHWLDRDPAHAARLQALAALLVAPPATRPRLTVFKSLGMGVADLAMATEILRRAVEQGAGARFGAPAFQPVRIHPQS